LIDPTIPYLINLPNLLSTFRDRSWNHKPYDKAITLLSVFNAFPRIDR
jgi:hypothetical protein